MKNLNRIEAGNAIFNAIKSHLENQGYTLWGNNPYPNLPVSVRAVADLKKGKFTAATLKALSGIVEVRESFEVKPKL